MFYVLNQVFDEDLVGPDELLGELMIKVSMLVPGELTKGWFHLQPGAEFENEETVCGIDVRGMTNLRPTRLYVGLMWGEWCDFDKDMEKVLTRPEKYKD
jgi:hypothetical protein